MKPIPLLLFFLITTATAADQKSLCVDFTKIQVRSSGRDIVRGSLYKFDNRLVAKVVSPILQYMIFDSLRTRIYNPGERAGVELHLKSRSFLPFFEVFIGFLQGSNLPPHLDFGIRESLTKGDSLITRWAPLDRSTSFRGSIEMVYYKDVPVRTTSVDKNKKVLAQMLFSEDTVINNRHVPRHITSLTMVKGDTTREEVTFSAIALGPGSAIPDEIRQFKIPPDIQLKVIEW